MESVLKKFIIMEIMCTSMELLVAVEKRHNFQKNTFSKEMTQIYLKRDSMVLGI